MALIVQKFGGTSVADLDRIRNVANRVIKTYDQGNDVVVILSAMAGITDSLIDLAQQITHYPEKRELDVLLATGEQTTAALLAMTLNALHYPAQSLLGHQVEVVTDCTFGNARIMDIGATRIKELLDSRCIVVVAGFQGCDASGNITTLGRGGSDTSAVAIAAAIKADICEIYTDVNGVYTTDPNICSDAKKIDRISYEEMLEMASLGAKVLQIRSVEFAKKYNVPGNTGFFLVSSVTVNKKEARITLIKVPDQPGVAAKIFSPISQAGINVDMIIQNRHSGKFNDLTFTVPTSDFEQAIELARRIAAEIGAEDVLGDTNIAKVSVIGVGMKNHSGVASRMFGALAAENINILMISTSEIRISCVIAEKYAELAVRALHSEFGLDKST